MKTDIESILNELNHVKKVEPNPFLFTRIQARLSEYSEVIPMNRVWAFAASLTLLLILNFSSIRQMNRNENATDSDMYSSAYETIEINLYHE